MRRRLLFLLVPLIFLSSASWAQDKKVDVFVTSWCPYCVKLEKFLKNNEIDYTRHDVERDADGGRLFSELGGEGVPLSRVGSTVIHGYDPEGIMTALKTNS